MAIYFIVILVTTALAWLYTRVPKASKWLVFGFMVLFPSLIAGLRGVGTDYLVYLERFELLAEGRYEITDFSLVYILMEVFLSVGLSYQLLIFLVALVTLYLTFYVFCRYENKISLPMAVFSYMAMFYLMSFNTFRQMLATAVLMLAFYHLLKKNRKLLFWLLSALAFSIHSAVVIFSALFFALPLIRDARFRRLRIIAYLVAAMGIMALPVLSRLLSIFASYFPHYAYYFLNFQYTGIGLGLLRYLVLCIIPLICVTWLSGSFGYRQPDRLQPYAVMSVAGSVLWLLSYVSTSFMYRIGYVGLAALPIIHGALWKNMHNQESEQSLCKSIMRFVLVASLLFFVWYDFIHLNSGSVYPYLFFWQI